MAALLFDIAGWEVSGLPGDREYISQLWAHDWENDDDALYDNDLMKTRNQNGVLMYLITFLATFILLVVASLVGYLLR